MQRFAELVHERQEPGTFSNGSPRGRDGVHTPSPSPPPSGRTWSGSLRAHSRSPTPSAREPYDPWLQDDPWSQARRSTEWVQRNSDGNAGWYSENGWFYNHHNQEWTPPPPEPSPLQHFEERHRGPKMFGSQHFESEVRLEPSGYVAPAWPSADQPREGRSRSPTHSPSPSPEYDSWGVWKGDDPTGSQGPTPPPRRRGNTDPIPKDDNVGSSVGLSRRLEAETGTDIDTDWSAHWRQTAAGHWYPKRQPGEPRRGKPRESRVPNSREEPREPGGSGW